jgi:hypothetical protein
MTVELGSIELLSEHFDESGSIWCNRRFILKHFLQTPEQGAKTALYLATSSIVEGVTGKYFVKGREKPSVPISYDVALQERIWKLSKTLVGLDSLPER